MLNEEGTYTALSIGEMITGTLSAVELVGKMVDPQFSRKARSADFVMHAWETLRAADGGSGDRVLATALDAFVLLVSRDPRDLVDLAKRGNLVPALFERLTTMTRKNDPFCILNGAEDDTELKRRGFGRADKLPVRVLSGPSLSNTELTSLFSSVTSMRLSLDLPFFPKGRQ